MESLAIMVSAIMLIVITSGPLAAYAAKNFHPILGVALGAIAMLLGFWALGVNPSPVFYFLGTIETIMGAWAIKTAIRRIRGQ